MPSGMPFSCWVGISTGGATEISECGMRPGVGDGLRTSSPDRHLGAKTQSDGVIIPIG